MRQIAPTCFSYADAEMTLSFEKAISGTYAPDRADMYWKIAIAVHDLDLACRQLREKGIHVPPPQQFLDVGYLTNFTDPEGFGIELIQHVFQGETSPLAIDPLLLGGGPCLNLLTLRCHDIDLVNTLCVEQLGMRLLSVQPVELYGFTLFFYAFTDEEPPATDLSAVVNRGWTYRRPYTVLEVQYLHDSPAIRHPKQGAAGYGQTQISGVSCSPNNVLGLVSNGD